MDRFGINDKEWPLVRVRWPRERPGRAELERYLEVMDGFLDRGEPFAMITDLRDGALLIPGERRWFMRALEAREVRAEGLMVASAVVTGSVLMSAVINMAHLLAPPTYPFRPFRKMADAEAWVREALAGRAADRPPPADRAAF